MTDEDVERIAAYTGESIGEVRLFRTRLLGNRISLTEYANGDCTYFDPESRRCRIYPVRPVQCRTWPFWKGNVASETEWERTKTVCPGAGRGNFVSVEEITRRVELMPDH